MIENSAWIIQQLHTKLNINACWNYLIAIIFGIEIGTYASEYKSTKQMICQLHRWNEVWIFWISKYLTDAQETTLLKWLVPSVRNFEKIIVFHRTYLIFAGGVTMQLWCGKNSAWCNIAYTQPIIKSVGYFWAFENSLPPACLVEEDVTEVPSGVVVPDGPYFLNDIIPWDNLSAHNNSVEKL